jgi:uncharacterized Zn finger protein
MIARASCPKCGHHDFEAQTHKSRSSGENFTFVQCTDCGTVVGVDFSDERLFEWKALIDRVENIEKILKDVK